MKIALYIEEGLEQIVLTPQTEVESDLVNKLAERGRELEIKRGSFYACQGGWIRHGIDRVDDDSVMLVLRHKADT